LEKLGAETDDETSVQPLSLSSPPVRQYRGSAAESTAHEPPIIQYHVLQASPTRTSGQDWLIPARKGHNRVEIAGIRAMLHFVVFTDWGSIGWRCAVSGPFTNAMNIPRFAA